MIYKNLNTLIQNKKFTKSELAELLFIKQSKLSKLLKGEMELNYSQIVALVKYTHYSFEQLSVELMHPSPQKLKDIKMLILDVDGVMTDGGMYYTESGDEFKKFNTKDGIAIKALTKKGFAVGIISNGINKKLINSRAKLLGIQHVYVGTDEKIKVLQAWIKKIKIKPSQIAYIGDDVNDIAVMQSIGFTACPADAMQSVKSQVNHILQQKGGQGCVREFCDTFLL